MPEPIEVTSDPIAISVEETVTMLCEDMRKMHERLSRTNYDYEQECLTGRAWIQTQDGLHEVQQT